MKPSVHLLILLLVTILVAVGHVALIVSGEFRGFHPGIVAAVRDLLIFVPVAGAAMWLVRTQRFRGNLTLLTAAVCLFGLGQLAQYRLFTDPEYGTRGEKRREAREAKLQTQLRLNIDTGYDDEKKKLLFGTTQVPPAPAPIASKFGLLDAITSGNTVVPILGLALMLAAFLALKRDDTLDLLQRNALLIGGATAVVLLGMVALSSRGKFLGETTPWEIVKPLFLVTFGGLLAESYVKLGKTRWGMPPLRFFLPIAVAALLAIAPFFVLSDFGQLLVFGGVYALLYFLATRKWMQAAYALTLATLLFAPIFTLGIGVPNRVFVRFHLWLDTWTAPAPETKWWKPYAENIREQYPQQVRDRVTNDDAWFEQSSQLAQGLFGLSDGNIAGKGLGLGYPEVVPVADSDFVYAALGEEFGLAGGLLIVLLLSALVIAGIETARGAPDMFTKLLAAGFTGFIAFQAIVNIGGVIRLLPMTGITLPFVSHGGWSLLTSFVMLGGLLAISHRNAGAATVAVTPMVAETDRPMRVK